MARIPRKRKAQSPPTPIAEPSTTSGREISGGTGTRTETEIGTVTGMEIEQRRTATTSGLEISGGTETGTGTGTETGTRIERRRTATHDSYINILLLDGEEAITLKVQNQDHGDTYVRTGRNVPLSFLMRAYADGPAGLVYDQIRFIYDGKRITENETAEQLGMEEGDAIDAMSDMTGGASC